MKSNYAILKVHLVDTVPAYEFSKLASLINDLYDTFLWVETVKIQGAVPYSFNPNDEDRLYIKKADIGTPNLVEFIGIAEHLVNALKFLAENYNDLLSIGEATLITVEKSDTVLDFMSDVKSGNVKRTSKDDEIGKEDFIKMNKSLEEELMHLKNNKLIDKESEDEKSQFMSYVKSISQLSENIIIDANLTIVKSD